MATINQLPSGRWRAQIRRKALGRHEELFDTEEEARAWANETEARLMSKAVLEPLSAQSITFLAASQLYQKSPVYLNKAPGTRKRETFSASYCESYFGSESLASITRHRVQTFIDKRTTQKTKAGKSVSGDTIRLEKAYLSAVFRFAIKRGLAEYNPANAELDLPRCHIREIRITPEQEAALLTEAVRYGLGHHLANPNLITWAQFVFYTGTRPGEAAKIELSWLRLDQSEIHIPRMSHKTRRPRVILLTPRITEILKFQLNKALEAGSKYLFWSESKKGISPYNYHQPWRKICRRVGLPDTVVPHGVRHEFISRLFEHTNLSDTQVAAIVGDVHVLSLEPYKHLRTNKLRGQLENHLRDVIDSIHDSIDLQPS